MLLGVVRRVLSSGPLLTSSLDLPSLPLPCPPTNPDVRTYTLGTTQDAATVRLRARVYAVADSTTSHSLSLERP